MSDITAFMTYGDCLLTQPLSSGLVCLAWSNAMKVRDMKYYFVEFYNENINHHSPGPGTVTSRYSLILKAGIFLCWNSSQGTGPESWDLKLDLIRKPLAQFSDLAINNNNNSAAAYNEIWVDLVHHRGLISSRNSIFCFHPVSWPFNNISISNIH